MFNIWLDVTVKRVWYIWTIYVCTLQVSSKSKPNSYDTSYVYDNCLMSEIALHKVSEQGNFRVRIQPLPLVITYLTTDGSQEAENYKLSPESYLSLFCSLCLKVFMSGPLLEQLSILGDRGGGHSTVLVWEHLIWLITNKIQVTIY